MLNKQGNFDVEICFSYVSIAILVLRYFFRISLYSSYPCPCRCGSSPVKPVKHIS